MPARVVLVNSNRIRPPIAPLALEYLADALSAVGLPWAVADLCLADDAEGALRAALTDQDALLVAVTFRNTDDCFCATQHSFVRDLERLVRDVRALTDAPLVLGGAGYSVAPLGLLRRTGADFGVQGDGEAPLVELAQALRNDSPFDGIPGLVWRESSDLRANPPAWSEVTQHALLRTALDNARYFREGGQLGIETKRGCPAACTYCADRHSKGAVVRPRPPGAVAEEMLGLAAQGLDVFHTCDSEFNSDPDHAAAVCEALIDRRAAEHLRWYAYCAPQPFPVALAERMRRAGCVGINFGTDSGDGAMLQTLGRAHTPEGIRATVRACRAAGLTVMLDLLLGAPGETPESLQRSLDLVRDVEADCAGIALGLRLYPGTSLTQALLLRLATGHTAGFRGQFEGNEDLAEPLFFLEPALGGDPVALLKELIAGDQRFFFSWPDDTQADYNYDGSPVLEQAIREGHRGAYWDILRKLRGL